MGAVVDASPAAYVTGSCDFIASELLCGVALDPQCGVIRAASAALSPTHREFGPPFNNENLKNERHYKTRSDGSDRGHRPDEQNIAAQCGSGRTVHPEASVSL